MNTSNIPAGWYQDPTGQGDGRYWNGVSWTESVDRGGVTLNVPIDPSQAQVPPVPGTQIVKPVPQAAAPQTINVSNSKSSPWGAIFGVIVVLIVIAAILFAVGNSSDDTPTPGTDAPAPAATDAPAPPASDGG